MGRYRQLVDKVDAFVRRVEQRHGSDMRCAPGCDACCRQQLSVTEVEAAAVAETVASLPSSVRSALATRATHPQVDRCAALESDGRCAIYEGRPLVCRSHGVPVRTTGPAGLPIVDACALNFTARGPASVDADCVLDQATLSTLLLAIDVEYCQARGLPSGSRRPLSDVLREAAS